MEAAGSGAVIAALSGLPSDAAVQEAGLGALAALAAAPATAQALGASDAAVLIIQAMGAHLKHEGVQEVGARALGALA